MFEFPRNEETGETIDNILDLLSRDQKEELAKRAVAVLRGQEEVSESFRTVMKETFRRVRVEGGFKNKAKAPADKLLQAIRFQDDFYRPPLFIALQGWQELESKWMEESEQALEEDLTDALESLLSSEEVNPEELKRVYERLVDHCTEALETEGEIPVRLTAAALLLKKYLTERCSAECEPDLQNEEAAGSDLPDSRPLTDFWKEILAHVGTLGVTAEEWDQLPLFIGELTALREEKVDKERVAEEQAERRRDLEELLRDYGDYLEQVFEWSSDRVERLGALQKIDKPVHQEICDLREVLAEWKDLEEHRPQRLSEKRAHRERLEDVEAAIQSKLEKLLPLLQRPEEDSAGNSPSQSEKKEVWETDATKEAHSRQEDFSSSGPDQEVSQEPAVEEPVEQAQGPADLSSSESLESNWKTESRGGIVSAPAAERLREDESAGGELPEDEFEDDRTGSTLEGSPEVQDALVACHLPAAYWMLRGLEQSSRSESTYAPVIAAIQGSWWIRDDSDRLARDLLEIVTTVQLDRVNFSRLLALAATFRPVLVAPSAGLLGWLNPCGPKALVRVVDLLREFATYQYPVRDEDLQEASGLDQQKLELKRLVQEAQSWLNDKPASRMKFKPASKVLHDLVSPKRELGRIMTIVAEDSRERAEGLKQRLQGLHSRDEILNLIDRTHHRLVGGKSREIVSGAREQLVREVENVCDIGLQWADLVQRVRHLESHGDWLIKRVQSLRDGLREVKPKVDKELQEAAADATGGERTAYALVLESLSRLLDQLEGKYGHHADSHFWMRANSPNLDAAMRRFLLLMPELPLSDDMDLPAGSFGDLPAKCSQVWQSEAGLQEIIQAWIDKKDLRFCEILLTALPQDVRTEEQDYLANTGRRYTHVLQSDLTSAQSLLEQAVIDGVDWELRADIGGQLEDIQTRIADAAESHFDLNFAALTERIDQLRVTLAQKREERLTQLQWEWKELADKLKPLLKRSEYSQIHQAFGEAVSRGDSRLAEEYVSVAHSCIESGQASRLEELIKRPEETDYLAEFLDDLSKIEDGLQRRGGLKDVAVCALAPRNWGPLPFGELPRPRRDEVSRAVGAWTKLKQAGDLKRETSMAHLEEILRYLSMTPSDESGPTLRLRRAESYWAHVEAAMSVGDLAKPIADFGSQISGAMPVLAVWERPGVDLMASWLSDLKLQAESVLILYLGRLKKAQREEWARQCRRDRLKAIVLDETVLVSLARHREPRFPPFLRIALPFSQAFPFVPYGNVPEEMFFGRREMIRDLLQATGSCLVYGGRQFGKSALLKTAEREFHNPDAGQYSTVVDIRNVGTPETGKPPEDIWDELRVGLQELGIVSERATSKSAKNLVEKIRKFLAEGRARRIILHFDESDAFLDADSRKDFPNVDMFRRLMFDTDRRFKVVFAGLHNVQRFQFNPNQPLAHFGTPITVGPLEPNSAKALIREPFRTLGFRLDEPAVHRILAYTNYHAGLIQLFCRELLKRLYEQIEMNSPPYPVGVNEIDEIYRIQDVRKKIRDRFEWTLALDKRYQLVAFALVLEQLSAKGSGSDEYSARDVLAIAKGWHEGFETVDLEELRGILDEMCGLGVLIRTRAGRYRMRSPNVARLMGTEEEVEGKLLEAASEEIVSEVDYESVHVTGGDPNSDSYTPLTSAQAQRLTSRLGYGTTLVWGSAVAGIRKVDGSLRALMPAGLETRAGLVASPGEPVRAARDLRQYLDSWERTTPDFSRAFITVDLTSDCQLKEIVECALAFTYEKRKRMKNWLKILILLDPANIADWLRFSREWRENVEDRCDTLITLRRWNEKGVKQWLGQQNMIDRPDVCKKVLQATGGWPFLIEELLRTCNSGDASKDATRLRDDLCEPGSLRLAEFHRLLGIQHCRPSEKIVKLMVSEADGPMDLEFIQPDFLESLSAEDCEIGLEFLQCLDCIDIRDGMVQLDPITALCY